ncbi:cation channel sperm-associated protein 1 [Marmota flaviventris]|uniref:cation channel sperm-associated protein 1 n=1 Tax=Marmota flaviventris TaxID=93162 RepID=UPI003A89D92D
MDQSSVTERIQNDLDTLSHPHSSSPYHRPGPSGAHHHETHHHRGPHHHSGLRHHGGPHYQDPENPYSYPFHHRDKAHYRGRAHHYPSPGCIVVVGPTILESTTTVEPTTMGSPASILIPSTVAGPTTIASITILVGTTIMLGPTILVKIKFITTMVRPITLEKIYPSTPLLRFTTKVSLPIIPKASLPTIPMASLPTIPMVGPTNMVKTTTMMRPIYLNPTTTAGPTILIPTTTEDILLMERAPLTVPLRGPTSVVCIIVVVTTAGNTLPRKSRSLLGSSPSYMASHSPGITHTRSWGHSVTQSHVTFYSSPSRRSSKIHPRSSKDTESWSEDEHFQKRKLGRSPRAHKKMHTMDLFQWLWDKLSHLVWGFRRLIWRLTQSLAFETFIFLVVCLNTVMLVAQTFAEVEIRGEWYFLVLDCIFLCIYVMEALLKIIALGLAYFFDFWNNLDFFIMLMAVLDFVLMQVNSLSFSFYNHSLFRILKVFKSMRALRAIRVLRRLSILNSLQEVTGTLGHSLPSIAAILTLMFTCLFLFSVVLRALFRKSDPMRFQNIFTTIFTLFTLLTLDDWSLIYMDSRARGAWYIIPILMIYIIIQYFIFLNLVIAVLVDNFQMALLRGLEKVKQEKAAQIHENLLEDSLTELRQTEPEETVSETTLWNQFIDRKFGAMTDKQRELQFQFLQLVAGVEYQQQKFRSQASVIDEIVDTAFEAGEEDFKK